jgi:hypothetical protein
MDAKEFLGRMKTPLAEGSSDSVGLLPAPLSEGGAPTAARVATPTDPSASGASEPVSEQDSLLVFSDTTPSGIVVEYSPGIPGSRKHKRFYRVNGVEVVSVTTALKVLHKDLGWWGQGIGVAGVLELFDRGVLSTVIDWATEGRQKVVLVDGLDHQPATADTTVAALTANKITVNHTKDKAADRGTNVHSALEKWAESGGQFFPTPQEFPEEEQSYVSGVLDWIDAMDGAGKPVLSEVMLGSSIYGFAGRCDLVLELSEPREFVVRALKTPKTIIVQPGRYMVDMKTKNKRPKEPYTADMKQLAAYEIASVEGGYRPTDGQFVLYVMANGTYEFAPSYATADDFLAVLAVYDADKAMKERKL